MQRRKFLQTIAGSLALGWLPRLVLGESQTTATAAAAATSGTLAALPKGAKLASDRVILGPKRIEVSRLAMGSGTKGWKKSSNQTRKLGLRGFADLLRSAYDQGITFWESADLYGSHPHFKEALQGVPRDKVVVLTKTHAKTQQEMKADLDRFRAELGTDYIDILLLHCMTDADWNQKRRGAMDALSEAQQQGIVRSVGVSCHSLEALKTAAAEPWVEIDLARINHANVNMDADKETVVGVLEQMKKAGKGVIGMKIVGEGKLRESIDESLRYVLSLACVDCFTVGFESPEELQDMVRRIPAQSV